MRILLLQEVIWRFYQEGRVKTTVSSYRKEDIGQACKMSFGASIRNQLNASIKKGTEEYSFLSPLIRTKEFEIDKVNSIGKRKLTISGTGFFTLPENKHIISVLPVGECDDSDLLTEITQVRPGEERFYLGPEFDSFKFYVIHAEGFDVYHLPPCVKKLSVQGAYDVDGETDISLDTAFEVAISVLGMILKVPGFAETRTDNPYKTAKLASLKRALQQQEAQPGGDINV